MASFVVKAAPRPEGTDWLRFDEKTMWRGKDVRAGDKAFIFAAEHNGGRGLYARGVVTEAVRGVGSRVSLTVKRTGTGTAIRSRRTATVPRSAGRRPGDGDRPQALPSGDQEDCRRLRCCRGVPSGLLLKAVRPYPPGDRQALWAADRVRHLPLVAPSMRSSNTGGVTPVGQQTDGAALRWPDGGPRPKQMEEDQCRFTEA
jgi:hypothetical protein